MTIARAATTAINLVWNFVWVGVLLSSAAWAQFTTVAGTVTDPNGLPYAGGTIAPVLVSSGSPTLNGLAYTPPSQPVGLNSAGSFTMRLADNTLLSPAASTWTFTVCSSFGSVQPAFGKGPVCFVVTGITISGASQDIGATLSAAALPLTANFAGSNIAPGGQAGDILRFNVNGDSLWDPASYAQSFVWAYAIQDGMGVSGLYTGGGTLLGSGTNIFPTAANGFSRQLAASAAGSTNTVVGVLCCTNGNNTLFPFLAFWRTSIKVQFSTVASVRYWIGLANWNVGSGLGNNNVQILNTTAYAADIPNKTTLAFRFSAGTDTTWKGIAINAGGSPTSSSCDTGVAPDIVNPHVYELVPNLTGTTVAFFIDGTSRCSISSNLPNVGLTFDSEAGMFFSGDNKNTATAITATWSYLKMALKQ